MRPGVMSTGGDLQVNVRRCRRTGSVCRRMYVGVWAAGAVIQVFGMEVNICSLVCYLRVCRNGSPRGSSLQ